MVTQNSEWPLRGELWFSCHTATTKSNSQTYLNSDSPSCVFLVFLVPPILDAETALPRAPGLIRQHFRKRNKVAHLPSPLEELSLRQPDLISTGGHFPDSNKTLELTLLNTAVPQPEPFFLNVLLSPPLHFFKTNMESCFEISINEKRHGKARPLFLNKSLKYTLKKKAQMRS